MTLNTTLAPTGQHHTTGLILAGGEGRRVGGRDKGLVEWRGEPLVAHVLARLSPQVHQVIISCNRNQDRYRELSPALVPDLRRGHAGPLAGIEAAAPKIAGSFLVVVPCDVPLLPPDLVPRLLRALAADGGDAIDVAYAADGQRAHWLCAAMHTGVLATLGGQLDRGNGAVREWYATLNAVAVDFSDCAGGFRNLNRIDDWG